MFDLVGTLKLALVQKEIFCPFTGEVLDIRTAVFLTDADGDPAYPMSPKAWEVIRGQSDYEERMEKLAEKGLFPPTM